MQQNLFLTIINNEHVYTGWAINERCVTANNGQGMKTILDISLSIFLKICYAIILP